MSGVDLRTIAPTVADALGFAFERENASDSFCVLRMPDGSGLTLRVDGGKRITASAYLAAALREHMAYNDRLPTIGVAADSPPERIVAAIRRRLLPTFADVSGRAAARKAGADSDATLRDVEAARIATLTGGEVRNPRTGGGFSQGTRDVVVADAHHFTFRVRCYDGQVSVGVEKFDSRELPDVFEAVVGALANRKAVKS